MSGFDVPRANIVLLAIIVACLATFRNLFSRETTRSRPTPRKGPGSSNQFLRGSKPRDRIRNFIDTLASVGDHRQSSYQLQDEGENDIQSIIHSQTTNDSYGLASLPKAIHVRNNVNLDYSSRV